MQASGLLVRDVFDVDRSLAVLVPPETPMGDVLRRFVARTDLRGVFVVDAERRLIGVITREDLVAWAGLALRDHGLTADLGWRDLFRLAQATSARDACRPGSASSAVRPTDTLGTAARRMLRGGLIDVPVVDEEGRVIGDVRLSEILLRGLEAAGAEVSEPVLRS